MTCRHNEESRNERDDLRPFAAVRLFVLASDCATPHRWEQYSAPPIGTTWTNQFRSSGSYAGPPEINSRMGQVAWDGKPHIAFHDGPAILVARPDDAWVTMLGADGKPVASRDLPTSFEWPMYVRRTRNSRFNLVNHARNRTVAINAKCVVEAFEEVAAQSVAMTGFASTRAQPCSRRSGSRIRPLSGRPGVRRTNTAKRQRARGMPW